MGDRDLQELQAEIDTLKAQLAELRRGRAGRLRALLIRAATSPRARLALAATVMFVAAVSYAATISVPNAFVNGTIADADEVNANFNTLVTESNAQDSRITTVENDLGTHEADASAHHEKTTAFSELAGLATDSQIPDDITINYAAAAGNADTLDYYDSTAFALSAHDHDEYYTKAYVDALEARIASLEATFAGVSRGGTPDTLTFSGMNVQVVDGSGDTDGSVNGLGNLILGYNENGYSATRAGSHNLVVGMHHEYTSYGGLVSGRRNTISGSGSSISGGYNNEASGGLSSVGGGHDNEASGPYSSVSGGRESQASGYASSISGGYLNQASSYYASVSGGYGNEAGGEYSSVGGGSGNAASGDYSSVSGGYDSDASAGYSSVSGGYQNWAGNVCNGGSNDGDRCLDDGDCASPGTCGTNQYQSVSGGNYNEASGEYSSVSGGTTNKATGTTASVSGGRYNDASGSYSSISGGETNDASADAASVSGGFENSASHRWSSVSGGYENTAGGQWSSIIGGHGNTISFGSDTVVGNSGDVYVDSTNVH